MTRARDVADTQDNLGGPVPPFVVGKNFIINGGFDIWQRGTSFGSGGSSNTYGPDRWNIGRGSASITLSRQSTGAPAGTQYFARLTSTAGSSYMDVDTYIETSNVAPLWGKIVTFSVKLRGNATFASNTGNNMSFHLNKSATVDAGPGATWTEIGTAGLNNGAIAVGTTSADWTTLTFSATVPNDGTANSLRIISQYNGTGASSGATLDMTAAQLEVGNAVTSFSRAGGTIQGELAACKRYYHRWFGSDIFQNYFIGVSVSGTVVQVTMPMPVTLRSNPGTLDLNAILVADATSGTTYSGGTWAFWHTALDTVTLRYTHTSSAFTSGRVFTVQSNNTSGGYIGIGAEL